MVVMTFLCFISSSVQLVMWPRNCEKKKVCQWHSCNIPLYWYVWQTTSWADENLSVMFESFLRTLTISITSYFIVIFRFRRSFSLFPQSFFFSLHLTETQCWLLFCSVNLNGRQIPNLTSQKKNWYFSLLLCEIRPMRQRLCLTQWLTMPSWWHFFFPTNSFSQ